MIGVFTHIKRFFKGKDKPTETSESPKLEEIPQIEPKLISLSKNIENDPAIHRLADASGAARRKAILGDISGGYPELSISYLIWTDGTTIYAKNGSTGLINYSGTDAATVIQNAITALTSGGKIVIKRGTYDIGTTLSVTADDVFIQGEGGGTWEAEGNTVFVPSAAIDIFQIFGTGISSGEMLRRFAIRDVSFDNTSRTYSSRAIYAKYVISLSVEDCGFHSITSEAIKIETVWDTYIENCRFQDCGTTDVPCIKTSKAEVATAARNTGIKIHHCVFEVSRDTSIGGDDVLDAFISENIFEGEGDVPSVGEIVLEDGWNKANIHDNSFYMNSRTAENYAIKTESNNNHIINNQISDYYMGINCLGATAIVSHNNVTTCNQYGIKSEGDRVIVSENILQTCGSGSGLGGIYHSSMYGEIMGNRIYGVNDTAITITTANAHNNSIKLNHIGKEGGSTTKGIVESNSADINAITENFIRTDVTTPITKVGSSTIVTRNQGYVTEKNGVATVLSGTTTIAVNLSGQIVNVSGSPTTVIVTPNTNTLYSGATYYVSTYNSGSFTINASVAPTDDLVFSYEAKYKP